MLRRAALAVLALLAVPAGASAAPALRPAVATGWDALAGAPAARGLRVETRPRRFAAFDLDKARLRSVLDGRHAILSVPSPDGTLERFRVTNSPVLAPALARRFPQIQTYAGKSLEHPGDTGRFDLGPLGFHASVRSAKGLWYVDPYYKGADVTHVAYYRRNLTARRSPMVEPGETDQLGRIVRRAAPERGPGDDVVRRVYRLALANDPSYAEYFGSTDLLVETAKATLMNRVNQLYNDDLAIRMELVGNDYLLNFDTAEEYAERYSDVGCDGTRLDENQAAIDDIIGDANYDIGHIVFGPDGDGGGIAQLDSVGQPGAKASGCTGLDPPVGDGFAIDYVAHEMGHQFGGPHTFDGNQGSCQPPNRDLIGTVAVEPGSGSSIQAYAGICDTDDLQAHSDPYFSQSSIDSIVAYITSDDAGATEEGTEQTVANHNPDVTAPADKTIPIRTPFTLTGSATDPDAGDNLVYLWEQNDPDEPSPLGTPLFTPPSGKTVGPLFRVFGTAATEDPLQSPAPGQNVAKAADRTRTFPDAAQIAADNTDAESGTCGASDVDCNSEVLPTAAYAITSGELNFRLTARDRSPVGGGVDHDDVTLTLDPLSGPFAVTSQASDAALTGGTPTTVEWNVAGTAGGSVDTPTVRISYSTDGGLTFGYEVVASTANDGTESVMLPNVTTTAGRFKVEAIGNYFFDVSDGDLTVTQDPLAPIPSATPSPEPEPSPAPTVQPLPVPGAPSPSPSPSPAPGVTSTPTPGATATTTPAATTTATATPPPLVVTPSGAGVRPDLRLTPRKRRVSRKRTFTVLVRCRVVGAGAVPRRCRGPIRAKGAKRRTLSIAVGATKRVKLKLSKKAYARLRGRRRKVTVRVTLGGRTASKKITLRRR